ncbi:hypothetical protein QZH41_018695 [Actinostola sp. cb2023]|nr:hypothetical protein QZH41_018695 [Actinostola sp. cb2023]
MDLQKQFPFGQAVDVYATFIHDESGKFFVQINNEEAAKLDELMEEIDQFVSTGQSQSLTSRDIEVGAVYLAQYPVDTKWYRARVIAVKPTGVCDVHFIDYGNTEQIPVKFVRHLKPSFLQLHAQAFECELHGMDTFGGQSFKNAISTLKELILEQEIVCVTNSVKANVLSLKLFRDASCSSSILDSLLSKVQRTPQTTPSTNNHLPVAERRYKTLSLVQDTYLDFHVSHVQDPYSFSCQLLQEIPNILELLDELAEEYSDVDKVDIPLLSSSAGYPCCAKFYDDDCWYRAVITNSSAVASGSLDVKFVDYGNSQTSSLKDVKGLKDKYLDIPVQAVDCSLYGVRPEGNGADWSPQAKELFSKLTSDKHIIAQICDKSSDGKYQVQLIDMTGDMDMQLDQILIAAKYAEKVGNTLLNSTVKQNCHDVDVPKSSKVSFPYTKEVLTPGKEEKVLVSSVTSPSLFFCMLYRMSTKLEKLMGDIKRHYAGLGPEDEWLSSPSVGDPCCAKFSNDNSWYRAVVTAKPSSGKVQVLFVDYGNSDTVKPKDIKRLAPQFSELPCQGLECSLHRVCPVGEDWKTADRKKFEELALEFTGKMTVISQNEDGLNSVELLITCRGKEVNVAESMLLGSNAKLVYGACTQSENLASVSSNEFPKLSLPLGTYEDVFITHVEDPANFWCQLVKHKDELDAIMNAIEEHCLSSSNSLRSPSLGLACCAQYSDESWYRATISGIKKNNQVEVHFMDYGNYDVVSTSKLRALKTEFMNLPAQSFKCRLEQIDVKNLQSFSPEVIGKFSDLTVDKELVGMIVSYDESAQQYLISCTDTSGGNTVDVYEEIASLMPRTIIKECVVPKQDLKPGKREHVCVTTVTGLSAFYCQLMLSATRLDNLMISIDDHYKKLTTVQEEIKQLRPGDYCVAKYTEDDSWYRAKIKEVKPDMKVSVFYIDFGNGEELSAKSVKRMLPSFAQLPEQVISCALACDTSGFSDSQFIDLTLDEEFDMEVVSLEGEVVAKVILYSRDSKKPVTDLLTKEKPKAISTIEQSSLAVGSTETVYVTFASSISKFYIQISKSGDSLGDLMNEIHEYYSKLSDAQDSLDDPQVGSFCVVNFSEDNGWYRAKVTTVYNDSIEVFYVDYGNSEVLPLSRAKTLKPEFAKLPFQTVHCKLAEVSGVISDEASSRFLQLVEDPEMPFDLKVVSVETGGVYAVDLINKETAKSINQEFASDGVIQKKSIPQPANLSVIPLIAKETYTGQCGIATSPSQFWFNLNNSIEDLNNLLELMAQHYESLGASEEVLPGVAVGSYCCCQYSVDCGWYRAMVMSIEDSQAEVCFVDFGNSEKMAVSALKVLKEEFQSLPVQAIQCSLNQAKPKDCKEWSDEAIAEFTDLVIEKDAVIKVIQKLPDHSCVVDLLDESGSRDLALNALVEKGFAADPSAMQDIMVLNPDYKPFAMTFSGGDYIDISPLWCRSPHDFYCQVLSEDSIVAFNLMTSKLQTVYSSMGPGENELHTPSVGMLCCILYTIDDTWTRGRITGVVNDSTLRIRFVDYGNEEIVQLDKVKILLPEFLDLPIQCVQCRLASIEPTSDQQWSAAAIERFLVLVEQKHLVAQVISTSKLCFHARLNKSSRTNFIFNFLKGGDGKLSIELYNTEDDNVDVNISEALATENHAVLTSTSSSPQPQKVHPKLSALSSLQPSTGDTIYITAVDSPDMMFCQLSGTEERLENLMGNLKDFYESSHGRQLTVHSISPHELCVALVSEDNAWYRAVAEEVSPKEITVRFIDYGSTETLGLDSIKAICDQFLAEQVLAVECKLSGVRPASDDGEWKTEASDFLANAGGDDGFILKISSTANALEVILSDHEGDLAQRLINEGLAKSSQHEPAAPKPAAPQPTVPTPAVPEAAAPKPTAPTPAVPEPAVAKPTAPTPAVPVTKSSVSMSYQSPAVNAGSNTEVFITDVTSPGQFYCQLAEFGDNLDEMMNSICDHYSNLDKSTGCLTSTSMGQPCVAMFEMDSMWYRASVESVSQNDVNVRFVDYGNTQKVKLSELKEMVPQFMKLPVLAVECTIDPHKTTWTAEETENFKAGTGENILSAKVTRKESNKYVVRIFQGSDCVTDRMLQKPAQVDIPIQVLQPNHTETVYVVFATSSTEICVQLSCYSDPLDQVMATIDSKCQSNQTVLKEDQIVQGMACCALFEDNWYRAIISSTPCQGSVTVEYVDYGNTATLPLSDLRTIPESSLTLPRQAIQCILDGPGLENVSKETLENTLMDSPLVATFVKTDGKRWTVKLKQDNVDVADVLLINTEVIIPELNFSEPELSAHSTAQVFVTHIESPGEFYIQMNSSTEDLIMLASRLNEVYAQLGPAHSVLHVDVGSVCCAQFSDDNSWYRGTIIAAPDDSHVQVHFVDYGNSDVVERSRVMVLREGFINLPVLAVQCSLEKPGVNWTDKDLAKFEALVFDQELTAEFIARHDKQWQVRLTYDGTSVLDLIRVGETEKLVDTQETCTIKEKEITVGQVGECGLSHAESTGVFYLQFLGDSSLDKVGDMIAEVYPSLGPSDKCLGDCHVGSYCCVKFSEDDQWYRAVVTELRPDTEAKVTFVDYGNSEVAAISSFKKLDQEFFDISRCSVQCRFANTKSHWSVADAESVEAQMLDKTFIVTFVKPNESGWDVLVEVEGTCLNTLPHLNAESQVEAKKSFSQATLSTGTTEDVKFLMAESVNTIWLQPVVTEQELTTMMNNIAESQPNQAMPLADLSVGKPCLCRFSEDDEWYRAEVLECKDEQFVVKYIDYGNTESVDASRISLISDALLSLPAQAIKCSLLDVPTLSADLINKLNEEYVEVQLKAEITGKNEAGVHQVKLFEADGRELVSSLVEVANSESITTKEPESAVNHNSAFKDESLLEIVTNNGSGINDKENRNNKSQMKVKRKNSLKLRKI